MGADPIGERFAAPAELGDEGLIRHLRISNVTRSPVVVQISGTSSLAHLEENMAAARLMLDDADLALLTRGSRKQGIPDGTCRAPKCVRALYGPGGGAVIVTRPARSRAGQGSSGPERMIGVPASR
jgi:hypothetical protein